MFKSKKFLTFTNQRNFFLNDITKKHFFKSKKSFFECMFILQIKIDYF